MLNITYLHKEIKPRKFAMTLTTTLEGRKLLKSFIIAEIAYITVNFFIRPSSVVNKALAKNK